MCVHVEWLSENKSERIRVPPAPPPTVRENKSRELINCDSLTNHWTAQQTDEDETLHPEVISIRITMYHLRVPVFLLVVLVLLRCIAAAPSHRNFSPGSSDDEEENALPAKEGLTGARLQRRLAAPNSKKPVCHTTTCLANSLADLMGHKGKGKGDVGPDSYGKRDIQPPGYLPF